MKKSLSLIIIVAVVFCALCSAFATSDLDVKSDQYTEQELEQYTKAIKLKQLGLFRGVSPTEYALEQSPTRAQAIVMLIRLLGYEEEAISTAWEHPFTDAPAWASRYIGYAYQHGFTNGVSATKFSPNSVISDNIYLTLVLRALGYSDKSGDFSYANPYVLAAETGLLPKQQSTASFTRGELVSISYAALKVKMKGSDNTLLSKLYQEGAVSWYGIFAGAYEQLHTNSADTGYRTVTVATADELVNAIASNTKILLKPGIYNLTEVNQEKVSNPNVTFELANEYVDDGKELAIHNVENCYFIADGDASSVSLVTESRYATVLSFEDCKNIIVSGITIGHTIEPGTCTGSVLMFSNTKDSCVSDCILYGCGTYGVEVKNSDNIFVRDTEIKDCTYGGISIVQSDHTVLLNCSIHDCSDFGIVDVYYSANTELIGCLIANNAVGVQYGNYSLSYIFSFYAANNTRTTMCTISDNQSGEYLMETNISDNVIFDRCVFQNNQYNKLLQGHSTTDKHGDSIVINNQTVVSE